MHRPTKVNSKAFRQRGMVLLVMVFLILLVSSIAFFSATDGVNIKLSRERKNIEVLSEAKAGLIGYALQNALKPGTLPCTDSDNDGSANTSGSNCVANIGRLPWKQLGLSMLKDKDNECLWYAISPVFRNNIPTASRATVANHLNSGTAGTITLLDNAEQPLTGVNPVIAVVIAPGAPVIGQNRSGAATTYCPGDSISAKYLDASGTVNNATGNVTGNNYTFKLGKVDSSFTDQITYITAKEFFSTLKIRMVKEMLGNVDVHSGPVDYYDSNNIYPCPSATVTGNQNCALASGFVPYNDAALALQYASLGSWLTNNDWFSLANYSYITSTHVKVTLADAFGSYTCDANMNVFTCSSP